MRVVVSAHNVVNYPEGGGHFWVYMQYVRGLRSAGCDVWWLERFYPTGDSETDAARISSFVQNLERYGLGGREILYTAGGVYINKPKAEAKAIFRETDLLLNFNQTIQPGILEQFRRTALVDIDPGLLQLWISRGQLQVPPHDLYFTTGETVGTRRATFPDCGLNWISIRPPVSLQSWPYVPETCSEAFTTISTWWGSEWIEDGDEVYENSKRVSFLEFVSLPALTAQQLELALCLGAGDEQDRKLMERNGWRVRPAWEVANTPEAYWRYIQSSRGEFSCAKPSCMRLQNAWVSDRTLCYLASGRPAVVQDTGPSAFLPRDMGMVRFSTLDEAAAGLEAVASNYATHSRAARDLAEAYFDARSVAERILSCVG